MSNPHTHAEYRPVFQDTLITVGKSKLIVDASDALVVIKALMQALDTLSMQELCQSLVSELRQRAGGEGEAAE